MRDAYNHRLQLMQSARAIGVKPAARLFATTVPTVRKWLRRYQRQGRSGLREHSRAPHACRHKTSPAVEQQVIVLRQKLPTFGATRLKREFDLPVSHIAIQRIWRAPGPIKKRPKKDQRKQDLAALKATTWARFQKISGYQGSQRFRATGRRRSSSGCPRSSTPPAKCVAVCCSGPSRKNAAPLPVHSSPHAFSSISLAAASRYAILSGKPTTAASSKEIFPTGSWMPLLENVKDNYAHRDGGKNTPGHSRGQYELPSAL
jgi:transposase